MKRLSILASFNTRILFATLLGAVSLGLLGCPVFDDSSCDHRNEGPSRADGSDDGDCLSGGSSTSGGDTCKSSKECGVSYTCGSDNQCHLGDCDFWGCVKGQTCEVNGNNYPVCVEGSSSSDGGGASSSSNGGGGGDGGDGGAGGEAGGGGAGGAGGQAPGVTYCGHPSDCGEGTTCAPDGTCQTGDCVADGCIFGYACDAASGACGSSDPKACGADVDCATSGFECIDGRCTSPADQCFDQGQCPAGDKCAAGKCTAACTADSDCPSAYTCNTTLGVCSLPAKACGTTNDCGGPNAVCVDGACVPRAVGGTCPAGSTWVENGCIPTQGATFLCNVDGAQDSCAASSICLHHGCYIACQNDGSICSGQPAFNQCKAVTSSSGLHSVCVSSDSGSECDPTQSVSCSGGKICIDGVCR